MSSDAEINNESRVKTKAAIVDPLKGISYKLLTEFATKAPLVLSTASIAKTPDVKRDAGLLVTKKQIKDLREYEKIGLELPDTHDDVASYLSYGAGQDGGLGLKVEDFLKTFTTIRTHAKSWSPLREDIMLTGTDLKLFGTAVQRYGNGMETVFADIESGTFLKDNNIKTLEDFKNFQLQNPGQIFPGLELKADTVPKLINYLEAISREVEAKLIKTAEVKRKLDGFASALRVDVIPAIQRKTLAIKDNPYPGEVKELDDAIAARMKEIEKKTAEYDALVQDSLTAVATLNIVGLGVSIYYGVKAEEARAARNKLIKEQDRDLYTLRQKNKTLGSLRRVEQKLQNLTIVAIDANLATRNLVHVWNVLHRYTQESVKSVSEVKNALDLNFFMTALRGVVEPWITISKNSDELVALFEQAEKEDDTHQGTVQAL